MFVLLDDVIYLNKAGFFDLFQIYLNKAGFFDLQTRREQQLAVVMYKIKHKMLPNYLQDTASPLS